MYNDLFDPIIDYLAGGRDSDLEHYYADMVFREDEMGDRFRKYLYEDSDYINSEDSLINDKTRKAFLADNDDLICVSTEMYCNSFLSKIKTEFEKEDEVALSDRIIAHLIREGLRLAKLRYAKIEKNNFLYRYELDAIENNFPICISQKFIHDYCKIDDQEFRNIRTGLSSLFAALTFEPLIPYKKVEKAKEFIDSYIPSLFFENDKNKKAYKNLLSSLRLFFLVQETLEFQKLIKNGNKVQMLNLFNKFYCSESKEKLSEEKSTALKSYSEPLFYYYPIFIRNIIYKYINNTLTDNELTFEVIAGKYEQFVYQTFLFKDLLKKNKLLKKPNTRPNEDN